MKLPKINPNQPITIDLETCDPELKYTAPGYISNVGFVAGIAIAAEEGSWYIPIGHKKGKNYDKDTVVAWLNEVCSADTDKIFHNGQYDIGWLRHIGVELHGNIFDTMLAAPLLNENRFSYQLDSLGKIYCGEGKFEEALKMAVATEFAEVKTHKTIIRLKEGSKECWKNPEFVKAKTRTSQHYELWPDEVKARYEVLGYETDKRGHETFKVPCKREADVKGLMWAVDPEEMGTYPIQDVDLTRQLYFIFKKEIANENLNRVMDLENQLLLPLLEMRCNGVRIDMEKALKLEKQYSEEIDELQKKIDRLCGFKVDINIDDDLIKICEKFELEYAKTEKGNPCFSSEMVPKDEHGIFEAILQLRKYFKARDTYIRGYIFGCTIDGWLHGQYNQLKSDDSGTVTGRLSSSCIAEETPVSIPGGYKSIEDIEPDDLVYCYTEDGTPTVSKVLAKMDKGIQDCVEVKWQSSGDGSTGSLICTPDHLIKTKKGWIEAGKLKRYDKMFHLRRSLQKSERVRIYGANNYMKLEEVLLKEKVFKAPSQMHIHHINHNKSDNRIENLKVMTAAEHTRHHGLTKTHKWEHLLTCKRVVKRGKENPNYKHIPKDELEQMLRKAKGRLTKVPMDFETFKKHCFDEHLDWRAIVSEYNNRFKKLTIKDVMDALHNNNGSIVKARKELGVGYINFKRFCVDNNISYNHTVTSVKPIGRRHVWDIEVEEHHNFIASEICVHNCPNMQNLPNPKSSQIGKDIRSLFLPDDDEEFWLSMDYSGQEPKMLVHTVIQLDDILKERISKKDQECFPGANIARKPEFSSRAADFHTAVATICVLEEAKINGKKLEGEELKQAAKKFRPKAKSIGLGVMYGSGNSKVAEEMTKKGSPMTADEAKEIRENIYKGVPFLDALNKKIMQRAKDRGYIRTILGRRGHFDIWEVPCWKKDQLKEIGKANLNFQSRAEASKWYRENRNKYDLQPPMRAFTYKALNKYIQGSSADQTKVAMLHLYKRNELDRNVLDVFYRRVPDFEPPHFKTQVHDEINVSIKPDEKAQWYQDIMENCLPLKVEVVADPVICKRWSEAK